MAAPVPFGWKVWCSVSPKAICLTVNEVGAALGLALAEPALELELELELEHPAVAARPAATTVTPSLVAVRRLHIFTKPRVCDASDARCTGALRAG